MLLETVRMVAAWLDDATHGVNAVLATLPTDGSDPVPASVTVIEETTSDRAAVGRPADEMDGTSSDPGPILAVVALGVDDGAPLMTSPIGDVTVRVLVRYEGRFADPSDGRRDAFQTMRAVVQCLREFSLNGGAARTRNSVALIHCEELRLEPGPPELIDAGIYGQVVAGWAARDLNVS